MAGYKRRIPWILQSFIMVSFSPTSTFNLIDKLFHFYIKLKVDISLIICIY